MSAGKSCYVVGFTVHEAKDLAKDGNAVDPLVVVRCLGREYKTDLKRGKLAHVKFEESFIWSDISLTDDEYGSAMIEFELQGACVFTRNDILGIGKVQLSMVRRRPNHTYVKKWLQLSYDSQLTSKMMVTVFSYGEGDDPPRPEDLENDAEETAAQLKDLNNAVMNTDGATIAKQFNTGYHLFVQVHRAEHLGGGSKTYNPYISVEFAGHTLSTPHASDTHTMASDECFRIPVTMPVFSDSIIIRVWDKKSWSADELIVQGRLSFSLIRTHALSPKWFNFYGFQKDEVKDVTQILSQGERPEPNSYQGRILVSGRCQKVLKESDLLKPTIVKGMVQEEPASLPCTLLLDVFEISGCPGKEVFVHVCYGRTSKKTKTAKRDSDSEAQDPMIPGIFRLKEEKGRVPPMAVVIPADPSQQLDLIMSIYANVEDHFKGTEWQRVGFARVKLRHIADWKGEAGAPRWVSCKPMAHMPSSIEPGAILCSIYRSAQNITERVSCPVRNQKFELRAYVCMARSLKHVGEGHPNPYVQVTCAGEVEKTDIVMTNANPMWGQCLQLQIRLQVSERDSKAFPEPIQIAVYDQCGDEASVYEQLKDIATGEDQPNNNNSNKKKDKDKFQANKGNEKDENLEAAVKMGNVAFGAASDMFGLMTGDVMAKKRMGAIANGRRAIGRVQIIFRKLSRPGQARSMRPKWVKIKGGQMGNAEAGDVLLGFELLKRKHSIQIPIRELKPPLRKCSLFLSILGLRNCDPPDGGDINSPMLYFSVPVIGGGETPDLYVEYKKKPDTPLTKDDVNKRWTLRSKQGFEFIEVKHMEVMLPEDPTWEPFVQVALIDGKTFMGEGRISLAEYITWVKPDETAYAIQAKDTYSDSEISSGEEHEGVLVSDDPEDREDTGPGIQYIPLRIENEPLGVTFKADDMMHFPPKVHAVTEKSKAAKAGVKAGDWLIGLHLPKENVERPTATWKGGETAEFLAKCDKNRMRPLTLRFRKVLRNEVSVTVRQGPLGLNLFPGNARPPKFQRDGSRGQVFNKAAIDAGWTLAAVNGTDTMGMAATDPRLRNLLGRRPCILTFRAPPGVNVGAVMDERKVTQGKPVQLNGMPWALMQATDAKLGQKLQAIWQSRVPKPLVVLPSTADIKRLNLHPARGGCLDVRGIIRANIGGGGELDDDDDHSRASVPGRLEDFLPAPRFESISLTKGSHVAGTLKMRMHVVNPFNPRWAERLNPKDLDHKLFITEKLRRYIKSENPVVFRVRTYIIRGLNVSGSSSGYGNPYLFFVYGQTPVNLKGHRFMNTTDPRFFRTEERDVKLPEQSLFEIGCNDYKGDAGLEDQLIGKSLIDLEDRWFSPMYKDMIRMNRVPIEYRPLETAESGSLSKGSLELWLELLDASTAAEVPLAPLRAPPPVDVEIRVVIWTVKNVSLRLCYDEYSGVQREYIDLLCKATLDSRSYSGSQPRDQETDVHHHSQGEGEFNWRFVWSKVQVTKGIPMDCFLQLSIWEHFAVSRPAMLCEGMIEMRNYCKKVALTGESISMAAELTLDNPKLAEMLSQDIGHYAGKGEDEEESGDEDDEEDQGAAMNADQEAAANQKPTAGLIKVLVEVYSQVEASMPEMKVGLARFEPNRLPILLFPKTGRSWKSVLPSALSAVESIIEAYNGGTKKCKVLIVSCILLVVLYFTFTYKLANGCNIYQMNCIDECGCCERCRLRDADQARFCFYRGMGGYPDKCATANLHKSACNCPVGQGNCEAPLDLSTCATLINNAAAAPAPQGGRRRLDDLTSQPNKSLGHDWWEPDEPLDVWSALAKMFRSAFLDDSAPVRS